MNHLHPAILGGQGLRHRDGLGILVEYHQPGLRPQAPQQLAAVPTAAESPIDEDTARAPALGRRRILVALAGSPPAAEIGLQQGVHRRLQQDGPVLEFHSRFQNEN